MSEAGRKIGPLAFGGQVRSEIRKVTWASRQETMVGSIMVFVMVTIAAIFFLITDEILSRIVRFVTGTG